MRRTYDDSILPNVRSEGHLLPMDALLRLLNRENGVEGIQSRDYHLAGGERLNEAINRSWQRMLPLWQNFSSIHNPTVAQTRELFLLPLFMELGYGHLLQARPEERLVKLDENNQISFAVSHFWKHSPIHLVGSAISLDARTAGVAGAAKSSPHGLIQEFLNKSRNHLWGFVSNGRVLRVLRDNISFSRQAYVEFDLQGIFNSESFSEFALLWLLCHQSRVEADTPSQCWLEKWSRSAQEAAVVALDNLRESVTRALEILGRGFMHSGNPELCKKLRDGLVSRQDYFRQLLRLIYRFIFLFTLEERNLLHAAGTSAADIDRYNKYYSLRRLRNLAKTLLGGKHIDLYESLKLVMSTLDSKSAPRLSLAPLGGFLWSPSAIPDLLDCRLTNRALLDAIRSLAFTSYGEEKRAIDWRHLGARELGSVYESLLELQPEIGDAGFTLVMAAGNDRKTSGSYYTPTQLIDCLLDSALDPVIEQTIKNAPAGQAEAALLNLKICDPACGSGHFLIAASHRLAKRLASLRTGDAEPSPEALRHALREVIGRCIYGVDLNPMSVELCKVSLWLEAMEPGKPLSFLDHHVQCANSLLGATRQLIVNGLPDAAFTALAGDDSKACSALKKRNQSLANTLLGDFWQSRLNSIAQLAAPPDFDSMPSETIADIEQRETAYRDYLNSDAWRRKKLLYDLWCAAFMLRKYFPNNETWSDREEAEPFGITIKTLTSYANNNNLPANLIAAARKAAADYKFFHLDLAFPEVAAKGGFDVILSNPPWERIKIQEKEWFASINPEISEAINAAARKKLIAELEDTDPLIFAQWQKACRMAEGQSHFLRNSGRYPLCGRGDINLYTVFAELMRGSLNANGRIGCIVPSGIATDDTTKFFFQDMIDTQSLISLYDFENKGIFPIDDRIKFCLLTCGSGEQKLVDNAQFIFFANSTDDLHDDNRVFNLSKTDIALINPNTKTCPVFRNKKDARLTKAIYHRIPVLINETNPEKINPWQIKFMSMFHISNNSDLFNTKEKLENMNMVLESNTFKNDTTVYFPLYEGKMLHQFNHRWATYEGKAIRNTTEKELKNATFSVLPHYWIKEEHIKAKFKDIDWKHGWLMGWRAICRATDERTLVGGVFPYNAVVNILPLWLSFDNKYSYFLPAIINSYVCDFYARMKVGGICINFFMARQLPVLPPQIFDQTTPWDSEQTLADWIRPRVLELTYTAEDLRPFAIDMGYDGDPFIWDEERRFQIRAELDAAFFHLYLKVNAEGGWEKAENDREYQTLLEAFPTPRHAVDYIMDTFPIVKKRDEATFGSYRTKETILKIYDEMLAAMQTNTKWQSPLEFAC